MTNTDIIVAGGGAAGLMAACQLSKAGRRVTLLEARDRLGGRIHTLDAAFFSQPAEAGAEFIHGNLPVTMELFKEAGLGYSKAMGEIWRRKNGKLTKQHDFIEQADLLGQRLRELKEDMTIAAFLDRYFPEPQFSTLRNSIKSFVEGYDAADTNKASAFAMREEWEGEDEPQYRPTGGYGKMIRYLEELCNQAGCRIMLSGAVKQVNWKAGSVEVHTAKGEVVTGKKLLLTLPVPVLQARPPAEAAVTFSPDLPGKWKACEGMGVGAVIKVLLEFTAPIWQDALVRKNTGANLNKAAWIFSAEPVPTWWTQYPLPSNLLTGWIAGPKAAALAAVHDSDILEQSLQSLAVIISVPVAMVKQQLKASQVFNWTADPFALGAYAYNTVETLEARKILLEPVEGTLFFAGEALYEGAEVGTVEAALSSGRKAAETILHLGAD